MIYRWRRFLVMLNENSLLKDDLICNFLAYFIEFRHSMLNLPLDNRKTFDIKCAYKNLKRLQFNIIPWRNGFSSIHTAVWTAALVFSWSWKGRKKVASRTTDVIYLQFLLGSRFCKPEVTVNRDQILSYNLAQHLRIY